MAPRRADTTAVIGSALQASARGTGYRRIAAQVQRPLGPRRHPVLRDIAESVAAGVDGVEHATFLTPDGVELDAGTVDRLAAAGVFVGATEAWLPGGPALPPADARRLEQCRANVVRMQRAGVRERARAGDLRGCPPAR